MEKLYQSVISGSDLISRQFTGAMFDLTTPEGPVLIYVTAELRFTASHPTSVSFLQEDSRILKAVCSRLDDGDDPCVVDVQGGCIVASLLMGDDSHLGYFMVFLPDYAAETVQTNMELTELLLAQAQLICRLIEKNNKLHQAQLVNLSKQSSVLGAELADAAL